MTTRERAELLSGPLAASGLAGEVTADALVEYVAAELGHPEILDGFRPYAGHFAMALPRTPAVHVVSGNTAHAALQSVSRGLLAGCKNLVKLPAAGLPEFEAFLRVLDRRLAGWVEVRRELPEPWLAEAGAVAVFGGDETVGALRRRVPATTPFQAHGHRVSFAVIFSDPGLVSVAGLARDVSRFNQQGCLSPHCVYVAEGGGLTARAYAARLAEAMAARESEDPRGPLPVGAEAAVADMRANYAFRAANDVRVQLWCSEGSTAWTVVYEDDPWFATSPLGRFVFVKPMPDDLGISLAPVSGWIGAAGVWPPAPENAAALVRSGVSRICAVGRMQDPAVAWHAEGEANLAFFVKWVDFEPDQGTSASLTSSR